MSALLSLLALQAEAYRTDRAVWHALRSRECACGEGKAPWQSFCVACVLRMPAPIAEALLEVDAIEEQHAANIPDALILDYPRRYRAALAVLGLPEPVAREPRDQELNFPNTTNP